MIKDTDKNVSRQMIVDLCKSTELEEFKGALKNFNDGIERLDMANIIDSLVSLDGIKDKMLVKLSAGLKFRVEKYLTDEQSRNIEMEAVDGKIYLVYKKYIQSYKKNNQIISLNNNLIEIDFIQKKIKMLDVEKEYLEAIECQKQEVELKRIELDLIKCKIEEMEEKRDSKTYVMSKVNESDGTIKKNIANSVKLLMDKNLYYENLSIYDDLIVELKEELYAKQIDYKKTIKVNYESILIDVMELQKGLMRRLVRMNFKMEYENREQDMKLKPSMLGAFNLYNKK